MLLGIVVLVSMVLLAEPAHTLHVPHFQNNVGSPVRQTSLRQPMQARVVTEAAR